MADPTPAMTQTATPPPPRTPGTDRHQYSQAYPHNPRRRRRPYGRGQGHSSRGISSHTVEDQVIDLEAVVRATKLSTSYLWAQFWSVPVAVQYAADNPGKVRGLVVWNPWIGKRPGVLSMWLELAERDWKLFLQITKGLAVTLSSEESVRSAVSHDSLSVSQAHYLIMARADLDRPDVESDYRTIITPALVMATDGRGASQATAVVDAVSGAQYRIFLRS